MSDGHSPRRPGPFDGLRAELLRQLRTGPGTRVDGRPAAPRLAVAGRPRRPRDRRWRGRRRRRRFAARAECVRGGDCALDSTSGRAGLARRSSPHARHQPADDDRRRRRVGTRRVVRGRDRRLAVWRRAVARSRGVWNGRVMRSDRSCRWRRPRRRCAATGAFVDVPVDDVAVGDLVLIRPGERIPIDGVVLAGESAVDQAPVTGESWPADKGPGSRCSPGRSTAPARSRSKRSGRPPTARSRASFISLSTPRAGARRSRRSWIGSPACTRRPLSSSPCSWRSCRRWSRAAWRTGPRTSASGAIARWRCSWSPVPCALVISTPVSIVSALTAAARAGVLIKGGAHLERLGAIRASHSTRPAR